MKRKIETLKLLTFENRLGNKENREASKGLLVSFCVHNSPGQLRIYIPGSSLVLASSRGLF